MAERNRVIGMKHDERIRQKSESRRVGVRRVKIKRNRVSEYMTCVKKRLCVCL